MTGHFDVAVVGAGVVGAALAREFARCDRRVLLLDAAPDVGARTSKANTAILHTGFDAKPDTLESRLVPRGATLLREFCAARGVAIEATGALLVAWDDEQLERFDRLLAQATANGYTDCTVLDAAETRRASPALAAGALGAIVVPDESIVDPWTPPIAFATDAVELGAVLVRNATVIAIERAADLWQIVTPDDRFTCEWVVNAAGLHSDEVDRLLGHDDFTIIPRRGELLVYDKLARGLLPQIVLPVPTATTKGVLVSPTVFGNVLVGPTADDIADKTTTGSTPSGIARLREATRRLVPELDRHEVTAIYAGLRAATDDPDYRIAVRESERTVTVGGIRSTGLTASLAIAEHVRATLGWRPRRPAPARRVPPLGEMQSRPAFDSARISADPAYGVLACFCERVSVGEVRDAYASLLPPVDLDGLRRRTRAGAGRCQQFHCAATLARGAGLDIAIAPTRPTNDREWDVVVIGGGPAGLAYATEAANSGVRVVVLERDTDVGGIPRISDHRSFGALDRRRLLRGPDYARRLAADATRAGVELRPSHAVTGWDGAGLTVTSPGGIALVNASHIVLATGSRERPRAARLVPGDRPEGVLTTGALQRLDLAGLLRSERAVVVGAEAVSYSAALTLYRAGAEVTMVTRSPGHDTSWAIASAMRLFGVPLLTERGVVAVHGRARVEAVELWGGHRIPCDTVVFTGNWVAEDELARLAPADSRPELVGNVRVPGRRADQCVLEARRAARNWMRVRNS